MRILIVKKQAMNKIELLISALLAVLILACNQTPKEKTLAEELAEIKKCASFPNENPYPVLRADIKGNIIFKNRKDAA